LCGLGGVEEKKQPEQEDDERRKQPEQEDDDERRIRRTLAAERAEQRKEFEESRGLGRLGRVKQEQERQMRKELLDKIVERSAQCGAGVHREHLAATASLAELRRVYDGLMRPEGERSRVGVVGGA